jgi:hypothetical protein
MRGVAERQMKSMRVVACCVAVLTLVGAFFGARVIGRVAAGPAATVTPSQQAFDFLIENVCLDAAGNVLIGVSPIDGDPRCIVQRDLRPGERLAYHLRESPADGAVQMARGRRRTDSFPVETRALGILAIHLYDLGTDRPGGAFDRYDPTEQAGGGGIAAVSGDTASYIATQLGRQNLKLFIGGGCRPGQTVSAAALRDSWVLAPLDKLPLQIPPSVPDTQYPIAGGVLSTPGGILDAGDGAKCPIRRSYGTTRWSVRPVTYRALYRHGPEAGRHVRLWTLIVERTGRRPSDLDQVIAFERAYFTRELGWTRWEAWKSPNASFRSASRWAWSMSGGQNQRVLQAHDRVIKRENCGLPNSALPGSGFTIPAAPADSRGVPRSDLLIVGCIELTTPVPPLNRGGDPAPIGPGSWYYSIVNNTGSPTWALFAR